MSRTFALISPVLMGLAAAQSLGTTPEVHPKITTYKCTTAGGCIEQTSAIVFDASTHPNYQRNDTTQNCGNWGSAANATVCPDAETCLENCVMDGISDYSTKGIVTNGSTMTMDMLSDSGEVYSPRVYLLAESEDEYEMIQLLGQEFTFDVDMSLLPCGMNAALYMSEMDATGGKNSSDLNKGGAAYGTGYCDAQCYTTPWINGVANIDGVGVCCNELDIWEANAEATQFAPHNCNKTGVYGCTGDECGSSGVCDKSGCGLNPYRIDTEYYGRNKTVDTNRPFTVVTQFPADSDGVLTEMKRLYVQDGETIEDVSVTVNGAAQTFMDDASCASSTNHLRLGGTAGMGETVARGMVLVFSLWWDTSSYMAWLDQESTGAGPCNATEGNPEVIQQIQPNTQVVWSNIRWGDIGSTTA